MNWMSVAAWAKKYNVKRRHLYYLLANNLIKHRKETVERYRLPDEPYDAIRLQNRNVGKNKISNI